MRIDDDLKVESHTWPLRHQSETGHEHRCSSGQCGPERIALLRNERETGEGGKEERSEEEKKGGREKSTYAR